MVVRPIDQSIYEIAVNPIVINIIVYTSYGHTDIDKGDIYIPPEYTIWDSSVNYNTEYETGTLVYRGKKVLLYNVAPFNRAWDHPTPISGVPLVF